MNADNAKAGMVQKMDIVTFTFTEPEITTEDDANCLKTARSYKLRRNPAVNKRKKFTTSDLQHLYATDELFCRKTFSLMVL